MNLIYEKILDGFINHLLPATYKSVKNGNKIFGGFILKKDNFELHCIGTNNEIQNPLFHGEITTLFNFYVIRNINPKDFIFVSSHEPCSLCLSAITWSGFDNFYYFFPYEDTNKTFNIPHDLNILKEVFDIKRGQYNKYNNYWKSYSIINEIESLYKDNYKSKLLLKSKKIKESYLNLSKIYQKNKQNNNIPLN